MKKFNLDAEFSAQYQINNKLKEVRLGLPLTMYNYNSGIITNSFGFHHLNFFREAIMANCISIDFTPEWEFKPQYIADEFLDDPRLHHLILFVNEICDITDFSIAKLGFHVKVPSREIVDYVAREIRRINLTEPEEVIIDEKFS